MNNRSYVAITLFLLTLSTVSFAARLPTVGSDTNAWGSVLNSYLLAEHGQNGTHTNVTAQSLNVSGLVCLGLDCRTGWPSLGWTISGSTVFNDSAMVGIGTANPTSRLHVVGTINVTNITLGQNCADGQILKWLNGVGQCGSDSTSASGANVSSVGSAGYVPLFYNSTTLNNSVIFQNGTNLGIGVTSSNAKLEISGSPDSNLSLNVSGILYVNSSSQSVGIGTAKPLGGTPGVTGVRGLEIRTDDNNRSFLQLTAPNSSYSTIRFANSTSAFWDINRQGDSFDLHISRALGGGSFEQGTFYLVYSDGRIGIGTTNPSAKLNVVGTSIVNNLSLNVNNILYVNSSSSSVGIGTANPNATFQIQSTKDTQFLVDSYGNAPRLILRRAGGTPASPTAVLNNQFIASLDGRGYDGGNFSNTSAIIALAASENWNETGHGSYMAFYTTLVGTTVLTERMRIRNNGDVGIGTTGSTSKLQVTGAGSSGLALNVNNTLYVDANATDNVGIGTANPTSKLHVIGTINVTNITLANNCADGQVLKWANGAGMCGSDSTGAADPNVWTGNLTKTNQSDFQNNVTIINALRGTCSPGTFLQNTSPSYQCATPPPAVGGEDLTKANVTNVTSLHSLVYDINSNVSANNATIVNNLTSGYSILYGKTSVIWDPATWTGNLTKANQSNMIDLLSYKANQTATQDLLSGKVNLTQISGFANDTDVNSKLSGKANQTDLANNATRIENLWTQQTADNNTLTKTIQGKANQSDLSNNATRLENLWTQQVADNNTLAKMIQNKANQSDFGNNVTRIENIAAWMGQNSSYQNSIANWLSLNSTRLDAIAILQGADNATQENLMLSRLSSKANQTDLLNNATRIETLWVKQAADNATITANLTDLYTILYGKAVGSDASKANQSDLSSNATRIENIALMLGSNSTRMDVIANSLDQNATRIESLASWLGLNSTYQNSIASWMSLNSTRLEALYIRQSADNATLLGLVNTKFNTSGGTITGSIVISGVGAEINDNLSLNVNNTLFVNASTSWVGIGISSPSQTLDVVGNVNAYAYLTNGTDYAERMEQLNKNEFIEPGDVVEAIGGRITKSAETRRSGIYFVVTDTAGVLGGGKGVPVSFIGQVRVKVTGKVAEGDFILPSKNGTAVAVNRKDMTIDKYFDSIGRALESKTGDKTARVLVAVGK